MCRHLDVPVGNDLPIAHDAVARREQEPEPGEIAGSAEEAAREQGHAEPRRQDGRIALGSDVGPDLA